MARSTVLSCRSLLLVAVRPYHFPNAACCVDNAFGPAVKSIMPLYTGFVQLGAGLSVGLAGLAAGFAIGIVGDAGVRGTAQQPRLFVGMVGVHYVRVCG